MRISDWSSDVCSSDLAESAGRREALRGFLRPLGVLPREHANWTDFVRDGKRFGITLAPLQEGFRLDADQLTLISEAQVFGQRAPAAEVRRRSRIRDPETDRKSVVSGKIVTVRVDLGGRRIIKKKNTKRHSCQREVTTSPY